MAREQLVIAGAGIAGLTAAICLKRIGITPLVLERAPGPYELGNGLQIGPNAMKVLMRLDLVEALEPHFVKPEALSIRSGTTGAQIAAMPFGRRAQRRWGAPYGVIARRALHRALKAATRDLAIPVHYAAAVDSVSDERGFIEIGLAGGETVSADALIAADGLWSAVRDALHGGRSPRPFGHVAWRAVAQADAVPEAMREPRVGAWLAPRAHAVHYPIAGGELINLVVVIEGTGTADGWEEAGDPTALLDIATRLAAPLAETIQAAHGWRSWPLFETRPAISTGRGAITLVGDAAHPMLPYLAQGAAMAIEDAWVLAECCAAFAGDTPAAFRAYELTRARRVARVQRAARRNGWVFHLSGPMRMARDAVLRRLQRSEDGLMRRYDWLYGGGPLAGES